MGRYRDVQDIYVSVLATRRTTLSDDHLDTIEAFLGMAEYLRTTSAIYPKDVIHGEPTNAAPSTMTDRIHAILNAKVTRV
jgi:hypothetical protein